MSFCQWQGRQLILHFKVVPRASKTAIGEVLGDRIKCHVQAPPVDGKANQALIAFLCKQFKTPKSRITLQSGETSPLKTVLIEAPVQFPPWCSELSDRVCASGTDGLKIKVKETK